MVAEDGELAKDGNLARLVGVEVGFLWFGLVWFGLVFFLILKLVYTNINLIQNRRRKHCESVSRNKHKQ